MTDNALSRSKLGTKRTSPEEDEAARQRFYDAYDSPTLAGKVLGFLGLDASGERGRTSWGDAALSTLWAPYRAAEGVAQAVTAPARALRGEMPNYLDDRDAYLGEGLNFAGNMAMGGSVVPTAKAKAAGRELIMTPGGYGGSFYGTLKTPAGNEYTVRSSNHAQTSRSHDAPDFNVAPGAMTPDEFIRKLPTLYSNSNSALPGTVVREAGDNALSRPGIRAYHGSPHDFDKFDSSKIGTGEGAQAFGHGLYFAENEGVARSYRDALSGIRTYMAPPRSEIERNVQDAITAHLKDLGPNGWDDVINLREVIKNQIERGKLKPEARGAFEAMVREGRIADGDPIGGDSTGRMYEVSINAHPDDFLDWDKPLSQQNEKVRKALSDVAGYFENNKSTAEAIRKLQSDFGGPMFAQAMFEKRGIPGIRYLDRGSRSKGEGTSNYVVFDDNLIEILRKYGLLGTLGGGAAALSGGETEAAPTNALARR